MTQVNVTQIQAHFADFLARLTQGETSIIIEQEGQAIATLINYQEWERLKQIERDLIAEEKEESFTPEEVIEAYNQHHGTEFSLESIVHD